MALLVLVDIAGFLWRAHHAYPPKTSPNGQAIQGVQGVVRMVLQPLWNKGRATHAAAAFDPGGRTFRHDLLATYKGHRPPAPPELVAQLPIVHAAAHAYGVRPIAVAGFEADDVLATLALQAVEQGMPVIVSSPDKDLLQLVRPGLKIYDQARRVLMDAARVEERLGVPPHLVADWLALCGDSADGFPGLKGVGPKIAADLLRLAGSLDGLIERPSLVGSKAIREQVETRADDLRLYRQLATLRTDVPVPHAVQDLGLPDRVSPQDFLRAHGLPLGLSPFLR